MGAHTHYSTPLKVKGRKRLSSTAENAAVAGVTCYRLVLVLVLVLVLETIQDKGQYFGHLMPRVDSLEKTLMLGGIGDRLSLLTFKHWRRKWQPAPVFLPGES